MDAAEKGAEGAAESTELYQQRTPQTLLSRRKVQIYPVQIPLLSLCLMFPSAPVGL